ncbi:MAG: pyrroloquinoline quinone-dependent dehydrogenase [Gemmatimonadota bacterium]|nr:pyrroloquinoline quinone-dependent dehydrogenase [Gemmatimonadota bacterium]
MPCARSRYAAAVIAATIALAVSCRSGDRALSPPAPQRLAADSDGWGAYGHDAGGTRYSPVAQINRENVGRLEIAWVYRTGDYAVGEGSTRSESTPVMVDGTLFVSTPFGRIIALDPARGTERWSYDPRVDLGGDFGDFTNRGVSTWVDSAARPGAPCRRRIFIAPIDARLIALDGITGALCVGFGARGQVDLSRDLINEPQWKGEYQVTSPPAVIGNLVIVGSAIADNARADAPSGVVRAFDARSGALRWSFDPIARDSAHVDTTSWRAGSSSHTGAANAWSIMSADAERDLLFVPVGSASPDFYGGERLGSNLYANSIVALRASTGKIVWHFQVVHHDLWDYDVPAQPTLFTFRRNGENIPAVAQPTKVGHLFLLDRVTGAPLFPVEERPVPKSTVVGEEAWPTQPFPTLPEPLVPQRLDAEEAFGVTAQDRAWCRTRIQALRSEGIFTPPSLEGTLIYPGNVGGSNWSSAALDPARSLLVLPTNRLATIVKLIPRADFAATRSGNRDKEVSPQSGTPYGMVREWLLSPSRVPCNPPPWSTLTAVDLLTGAVRWQVPLGSFPQLDKVPGAMGWGSVALGGPMITGGGLAFIAATFDQHLRAFDVDSGRELWSAPLPAAGNATPMTYRINGRQFVVISAGGHGTLKSKQGDYVIAFALPDGAEPRRDTVTAPDANGTYAGEIIHQRRRMPAVLHLRQQAFGSLAGELQVAAPALSGTLTGTRTGNALRFTVEFSYPEKNCHGTITIAADLANGGSLLVGEETISGECSGAGKIELGTLALRRSR